MLSAENLAFVRQHAYTYALPAGMDQAADYAAWYVGTYAMDAETLDDCPAHTSAWPRFRDLVLEEA